MFHMIGALITMTLAAIVARGKVTKAGDLARLGAVSHQWLAEYRATHPAS